MKTAILASIIFSLITLHMQAQTPSGSYEGHISFSLGELAIIVHFDSSHDSLKATIDIPQQGAKNMELKNVKFNATNLYFELPAGPGVAKFDGKIFKDSIAGSFTQATVVGTFHLDKIKPSDTFIEKPKLPYREEEISFTNGENTFAGTLTIPETGGKHPAVILITGSGAQNRDEEIMGFKPFKIIADHLSRYGIAVLRYDDRGFGESKGKTVNESTTMDFATDVEKAFAYLKGRSDIDASKIGLLGHSEGGVVAPMVASRNKDIAFIILMAGTAVKGEDVMNEQKKLIMQLAGATPQEIEKSINHSKDLFKALRTGKGMEQVKQELKEEVLAMAAKDTAQKPKTKKEEEQLDAALDAQLKSYQSPWMRYFIDLNPQPFLEKVTCPVLILFGELDVQVSAKQNEIPMRNALNKAGNKDVTIHILPKANHLFMTAKTGNIDEYGMLKHEFVAGFLVNISEWTRKVCKLTK